jgi:hypothetical protein
VTLPFADGVVVGAEAAGSRAALRRQGLVLTAVTIAYNVVEGGLALVSGVATRAPVARRSLRHGLFALAGWEAVGSLVARSTPSATWCGAAIAALALVPPPGREVAQRDRTVPRPPSTPISWPVTQLDSGPSSHT